jgi:hypothetical protein
MATKEAQINLRLSAELDAHQRTEIRCSPTTLWSVE